MAIAHHSPLPPLASMNLYRASQGIRYPAEVMSWALGRYGDPFRVDGVFGDTVITGDPEGIKTIFSADPDLFEPFDVEMFSPLLGPGSILLLSGARHKAERKLLMPPFHGARMRSYGEQIRETALRHAGDLPVGRPFTMQDLTQHISLEVIIRAVFGVVDADRVKRFRDAVTAMIDATSPWIVFVKPLRRQFGGLGPWARFRKAQDRLFALLLEEIDHRREAQVAGEDILSLLLSARYDDGTEMSREHIRDELLTLLFAGHETTAISLAWTFYQLCLNAPVRQKLLAELEAAGPRPDPEAIARLPYLEGVCNEVLRFRPVVPVVQRQLTGPFTLMGYELPAGMGVAASITLAHLNPKTYPEPLEFRPERFLERAYSPFEFLPFGGGARRCIGAAFALYEMKMVLAALLPVYELELERQAPVRAVRRNLTLGPNTGVKMRVTAVRRDPDSRPHAEETSPLTPSL